MNRIYSADRQRKAERSEKQRRCDNSRVKRTHASRPRCLRERFDQEGTKREREKREKERQVSLHLLHEPSNPWTAMPTHPPIDNRPLVLWNSGSCDTASDWSAAHLFSPASYRSRATPAQDSTSSHGFAPDAIHVTKSFCGSSSQYTNRTRVHQTSSPSRSAESLPGFKICDN